MSITSADICKIVALLRCQGSTPIALSLKSFKFRFKNKEATD
jgi:hypothetical protein